MTESLLLLQVRHIFLKSNVILFTSVVIMSFALSCRNPDETRVLPEEVLDCVQTGTNSHSQGIIPPYKCKMTVFFITVHGSGWEM